MINALQHALKENESVDVLIKELTSTKNINDRIQICLSFLSKHAPDKIKIKIKNSNSNIVHSSKNGLPGTSVVGASCFISHTDMAHNTPPHDIVLDATHYIKESILSEIGSEYMKYIQFKSEYDFSSSQYRINGRIFIDSNPSIYNSNISWLNNPGHLYAMV